MHRFAHHLEILQRAVARLGADPRNLLEDGYDALFIHQNGIVVWGEPVIADILGCAYTDLPGQNIWQCIAHESSNTVMANLQYHNESPYEVTIIHSNRLKYLIQVKPRDVEVAGEKLRVVQVRLPADLKFALRHKARA